MLSEAKHLVFLSAETLRFTQGDNLGSYPNV